LVPQLVLLYLHVDAISVSFANKTSTVRVQICERN